MWPSPADPSLGVELAGARRDMTVGPAPLHLGEHPELVGLKTPLVRDQHLLLLHADSAQELREHLARIVAGVPPTGRWVALVQGSREEIDYSLAASGAGADATTVTLHPHPGRSVRAVIDFPASDLSVVGLVDALTAGRQRLSLLLRDAGDDSGAVHTLLLAGCDTEAMQRARFAVLAAGGEASAVLALSEGAEVPGGFPRPRCQRMSSLPGGSRKAFSGARPPLHPRIARLAAAGVAVMLALGTVALAMRQSSRPAVSSSARSSAGAAVFRPATGAVPPAREQAAAAWDPATAELVVTGGLGTCCEGQGLILDDTWRLRGGRWSLDRGPRPRWGSAMAYDATSHALVLWGGARGVGDDTWLWNGRSWSEASPPSMPVLCEPSMATDPVSGDPWLAGSCATLPYPGFDVPLRTWRWHVDRWEALTRDDNQPGVTAPHLVADPASGSMLLVGIAAGASTTLTTWRWDRTAWQRLVSEVAPVATSSYAVAADAADGVIVLVADGGTVWTWDGRTWTNRPLTSARHPVHVAAAATDGTTDLFLGGPRSSSDTNELWSWHADRGWVLVDEWASPEG